MKILLSSYHNPHFQTITEYIEGAIKAVGHELFVFDDRQHIVPGRVRQRIEWLNKFDLNHLNRSLISLAQETRPDLLIVAGGHRLTARTVQQLTDKGIITALWTIDAPINFQPIIDAAPFYHHIFCQGTEAIKLLDTAGIKGAHWLPMACDPDLHRSVELSTEAKKQYGNDLVFAGSYYPNRAELFQKLADFDLGIWGPGWEKLKSDSPFRRFLRGGQVKPETWQKIYSAGKIVLATHYQDPENRFPVYQASPRIFEASACGAFVITDNQKDVILLFKGGEHLVYYDNPDDLIEKIKYYLNHPSERERIAKKGRSEVLSQHTYVHRIRRLLSIVSQTE